MFTGQTSFFFSPSCSIYSLLGDYNRDAILIYHFCGNSTHLHVRGFLCQFARLRRQKIKVKDLNLIVKFLDKYQLHFNWIMFT